MYPKKHMTSFAFFYAMTSNFTLLYKKNNKSVLGVLLQLVSCLQCRRCPHYFLSNMDLFRGKPPQLLEHSAKIAWNLVRTLLLCDRALESL